MGRRHVTHGARAEHYDTVITALMQTLEQVLDKGFTNEMRGAWAEALKFVATTMMRGARDYGTTDHETTDNRPHDSIAKTMASQTRKCAR